MRTARRRRHAADEAFLRDVIDQPEAGQSESPLAGLAADVFDTQWTVLTIEHHDHAAALAEAVQRDGSSRTVNNLVSGMQVDLGFETTTLSSR